MQLLIHTLDAQAAFNFKHILGLADGDIVTPRASAA